MRNQSPFLITMVLIGSTALPARAARFGVHGWERRFWDDHAVVIGTINKITKLSKDNEDASFEIDVTVSAVLATDHLVPRQLRLRYAGRTDSDSALTQFSPAIGGTYLLCIGRVWDNEKWDHLPDFSIDLFESGTAVQKINGPDDRLVRRAEKRIAWARGRYFAQKYGDPQARTAAETEPDPAPPRP